MNASYLQMSIDTWNSLADQDQDLVMQTVQEAKAEADEINREAEEEHLQTMRDAGMEIVEDFDRDAVFEAAREGLRDWFEANKPPITYDEAINMASLE